VNGVERADGLVREGLSRTIDDFRGDAQDMPARSGCRQVRPPVGSLRFGQVAQGDGAP
jgi:hypothetical protein